MLVATTYLAQQYKGKSFFHLHDNCYDKEPRCCVIRILPIFLYFHIIHEVIKVMDVAWLSQALASQCRVSVSIPGQNMGFGGAIGIIYGMWWKNWYTILTGLWR
jgi:hypothetical protein